MIVNNREATEGDIVFYIDHSGQVHEATIDGIEERDGFHYATLKISEDGTQVANVPHNTSPEKHSWNHPRSDDERAVHLSPDFYK